MPSYIMLGRYTEAGARAIAEAPARIAANRDRAAAAGITIHGVYLTMGEVDQVVIFEAPSDEVAMSAAIGLNMQGVLRTSTLRAFSIDEFAALLPAG